MIKKLVFLFAFFPLLSDAGCPFPDRPAVEEDDMVKRLNYYATGAEICIRTPSQYAPEVNKPGPYRCGWGGVWEPNPRDNECVKEIKSGIHRGAMNSSGRPISAPANGGYNPRSQVDNSPEGQGQGIGATPPISGPCKVLGTC